MNEENRMFFNCDEVIKVRFEKETYEITKNEVAECFQQWAKSEIGLPEAALYFYLPFLISIECKGSNIDTAMIMLSPINVEMGINNDLFEFLISKGKKK